MLTQSEEVITPKQAVLGLVNSMIGTLIMLLPSLTLQSGYLSSFIIILITGILSYFSCYLYLQHIGDEPDIGYILMKHFQNNHLIKYFYNITAWFFLVIICIEYFQLIVAQWYYLFPQSQESQLSIINPLVNAIVLMLLVILLKYLELGASIMVYGLISIVGYLMFMIWVFITGIHGGETRQFPAFGGSSVSLAAAMGQGYMIQVFMVPFLIKLKTVNHGKTLSEKFSEYTFYAYLIGGFVYYTTAYLGSFGIWHRPILDRTEGFSILAYFEGSWQVSFVSIVYVLHLYTIYPQFLLISKKLFFDLTEKIFHMESTSRGQISIFQVLYIVTIGLIGLIIAIFSLPLRYIMMINGAVLGFFVIYLFPSILHINCMFFIPAQARAPYMQQKYDLSSKLIPPIGQVENDKHFSEDSSEKLNFMEISKKDSIKVENSYVECYCTHSTKSLPFKIAILLAIILMISFGLFVMVIVIKQVAMK